MYLLCTSVVRRVLSGIARLQAFLNRCKRLGYCEKSLSSVNELFSSEDDSLFERIVANSAHVLQSYLQDRPDSNYGLRERCHNETVVKVRGQGGLSPLLPFEPPCNSMSPPD